MNDTTRCFKNCVTDSRQIKHYGRKTPLPWMPIFNAKWHWLFGCGLCSVHGVDPGMVKYRVSHEEWQSWKYDNQNNKCVTFYYMVSCFLGLVVLVCIVCTAILSVGKSKKLTQAPVGISWEKQFFYIPHTFSLCFDLYAQVVLLNKQCLLLPLFWVLRL